VSVVRRLPERGGAAVALPLLLSATLLLVAGCAPGVPDLGFPQTWSVAKVGLDSWAIQGSSITLESAGTGTVENVPPVQDGACWDGSQDTITSSIVWKVVGEGVLAVESDDAALEFVVDRQGLGSVNWEIIRIDLCPGVEGTSEWVEYGTIL
jgi:hypothetical protein